MEKVQAVIGGTFLRGTTAENGVPVFYRIPFASAERWQAPVPYVWDTAEYNAVQPGKAPVQGPPSPFFAKLNGELLQPPCDEDCLNLNIWPGDLSRKNKAVLFWVYGGAYIGGYNFRGGFTPETFSKAHPELVIVAPNYRLGVLGSLCLDAITTDEKYRFSNNLPLLDILEALRWTQANIAAFGGDPAMVTLYGHSAGSNAISHLLTMPSAKGLFRRAICQSSYMTDLGTCEMQTVREAAMQFWKAAGVTTLEQALNMSTDALLAAQKQLFRYRFGGKPSKLFSPVIDNLIVFEDGFRTFADGSFNAEQLMIGGSEGEYDQMLWELTDEEALAQVIARNRDKHITAEELLDYAKLYPDRPQKESFMTAHNMLGITLGGELIARAAARHCPVYEYQFRLRWDGNRRALHGAPTYYVFGTVVDTKYADTLCPQMMDAWAAFAATGNPNHSGIPRWAEVSEDNSVMCIDSEWVLKKGLFDTEFDLWLNRFAEQRYFIPKDVEE